MRQTVFDVKTGRLRVPKDENGRFPARHARGIDPSLAGLQAFSHPSVQEWHRWVRDEYTPSHNLVVVLPCSNVKPYTMSPTSKKVRGLLRRLGLWDDAAGKPRRLDLVYLSDLLGIVPYERAEEYPACCYELPPDILRKSPRHYDIVASIVASWLRRVASGRRFVLFLPSMHLYMWRDAVRRSGASINQTIVKYTIFGTGGLKDAILDNLGDLDR